MGKRYRVAIINSPENAGSLPFPDLSVKFSTGYIVPINVKEGDEIPIEALDSEDVRKSLLVGTLSRYIGCGKVIVEDDSIPKEKKQISESHLLSVREKKVRRRRKRKAEVTDSKVETPVVEEQKEQPKVSNVNESKEVDEKPSVTEEQPLITDLALVKTYDDFNRLSYFLKLRFIKESNDKDLLKEIDSRTDSNQFKNNIKIRISSM